MRHRYIVLVLFCLMLFLYNIKLSARVVYVSSSVGNNDSNGTIEKPFKTISKALNVADTIYLLAGDVFYETVSAYRKYISRYGKGKNPLISGYKRLIKPVWTQVANDVWSIDLSGDYFTGNNVVGPTYMNNIGCIHEYKSGAIHGKRVRYYSDLAEEWDFWQTEDHSSAVAASDFSTLYLKYSSNPNNIELEFSTGQTALRISETIIDAVDIEGFGFGISAGTDVIIRNCHIDAIGGMLFRGFSRFESYGNGIEFFVSKDIRNCIVENNIVSRTYDSGITIQVSSAYNYSPTNVKILNNLLISCGQAWEDYIMNRDDNIVFQQCEFKNNIIVNSGDSGFGYRKNKVLCNVLGYNTHGIKGMIIDSNLFIGGNYYSSPPFNGYFKSNIWKNNVCYLSEGNYIFTSNAKEYLYVPSKKEDFNHICEKYRKLSGDNTTLFFVVNEFRLKRLQKRNIKKFIKTNTTYKHQYSKLISFL